MQTPKRPNGAITLGIVVLLMVTATQFTTVYAGEVTIIEDDGSTADAECFDGGNCIVAGDPVNIDDLETTDGHFWHEWTWYSGDQMWKDVVEIGVWDTGCTNPPQTFCHIELTYSAQGDTDEFWFRCIWDDDEEEWTGTVRVNRDDHPCITAIWDPEPLFDPVCSWGGQIWGYQGHGGLGQGTGQC